MGVPCWSKSSIALWFKNLALTSSLILNPKLVSLWFNFFKNLGISLYDLSDCSYLSLIFCIIFRNSSSVSFSISSGRREFFVLMKDFSDSTQSKGFGVVFWMVSFSVVDSIFNVIVVNFYEFEFYETGGIFIF